MMPSQRKRVGWVDYARGIAIFSVVLWHVTGGLISNSEIAVDKTVQLLHANWETYALRCMPVFFFLSGVFAVRSLRKPTDEFLKDKARTLLYPYVVWSLITLVFGTITSSYTNHVITLRDTPDMLWNPIQHYWFFYALMVIMGVFLILSRLGISRWWFLLLGVAAYVAGDVTHLTDSWYVAGQICYFTVFFAAGTVSGKYILARMSSVKSGMLLVTTLAAALISGAFLVNEIDPALSWLKAVSAIAIAVTVLTVSELLDRGSLLRTIRRWGELSLEIYVAHVLALAAARIFLLSFLHVDTMWIHLVVGTVVGLYAPIVLVWALQKVNFRYAFSFPRPRVARQVAS